MMRGIGLILIALASFALAAYKPPAETKAVENSFNQDPKTPPPKLPTEVVHWSFAEVKEFEKKLNQDEKTSAQNPVLTITNVTEKETVRRTSFGKSGEAEIHGNVTDVFTILTGEAEFVTGGEIENARNTNPGEVRGPSIKGGVTKKVGTGDVIIIPPGTPHQIMVTPGKRVSFMVAKFVK
jgi:mannose-6-phosphate isomerase-like protein (cupin superfamily)